MGFEYIFEGEEWENTIFYYILLIFSFFLLKNLHGNLQDTFEEKAHNIKEFVDLFSVNFSNITIMPWLIAYFSNTIFIYWIPQDKTIFPTIFNQPLLFGCFFLLGSRRWFFLETISIVKPNWCSLVFDLATQKKKV